MHPNELFFARIALDRHRDLIDVAERKRSVKAGRSGRAPRARRQIAAFLIRWAHRLDPEAARPRRSPRYTA